MTLPRRRLFSALSNERTRSSGLFLQLDVAVADDPEQAHRARCEAGEQPVEIKLDHVFERDEANLAPFALGQADEAFHLAGDAHKRRYQTPRAALDQLQRQAETEVGNERERMGRVDRKRRQHRKEAIDEVAVEPLPLVILEPLGRHDGNARVGELGYQRNPTLLLLHHEPVGALVDGANLRCGAQAVLRGFDDARLDLTMQAGDADHVELVEVRCRDREKAQALQRRVVEVLGLLHHPRVEVKPAQLTIDELVGRREALRLGGPLGLGHSAAPAPPLSV